MKKIYFRTLFPAIIFSMCILELSFGLLINFRVVWWFYLFSFFFFFNSKSVLTPSSEVKVNNSIIALYIFSTLIYIIHHFFSSYIYYTVSSEEAYNILWWTFFGVFLILLMKGKVVDFHLFWSYTYVIVFLCTVIAAIFGLVKYFNILGGNVSQSYFYNNDLIIGSSLSSDYNVYSIGLLIGAVFSFQVRRLYNGRIFNILYWICLSIIYSASFVSGSRRGFLLTIVVLFLGFFYKDIIGGKVGRKIVTFSIVLTIVLLLLTTFWDSFVALMEGSGFVDSSITRIFSIKDELSGENNRTIRYIWAFDKFTEAPIHKLFFGSGFDYLSEMSVKFGDSKEDHPHNFILSTLLYGGILALGIMIILLGKILTNTFRNDKMLFIIFIILIFFSLSSANSLFSFRIFPIMVFLSSLKIIRSQKKGTLQ